MNRTDASDLVTFRSDLHGCMPRWADALFELSDAMLCTSFPVASVPALSLEPVFRRSHGSLYKSLGQGRVAETELRRLLVANRPFNWPMIFAVDGSTFDRCDAETSPERGYYYSASKHSAGQPIVAGWNYQWICQLNWAPNSWTAPLDVLRITPHMDTTTATINQIKRLVDLLPENGEVPLFVFDAGYDPIAISHGLGATRAEVCCRIRDDRVLYPDPPARPNRPFESGGRPPRHGKRFKCSEPNTWPKASARLVVADRRYGNVTVEVWQGMHPRLWCRGYWSDFEVPPIVKGSVIRVEVEHLPKPTSRAKKTLWLWWSGEGTPDLDRVWRAYLRRFDIEHTFRFVKNTLGWTTPSIRTPEQADRWTWLVVAAYTQLRLARTLVNDLRLPWERPQDLAKLTPCRVRRGFRQLRAVIGTPANPPKPSRAGPGRPKGTKRPPRTRYPAIKRAA